MKAICYETLYSFRKRLSIHFIGHLTSCCKSVRSEMMTTTKRLTMVIVPKMIIANRRNMAKPLLIQSLREIYDKNFKMITLL